MNVKQFKKMIEDYDDDLELKFETEEDDVGFSDNFSVIEESDMVAMNEDNVTKVQEKTLFIMIKKDY